MLTDSRWTWPRYHPHKKRKIYKHQISQTISASEKTRRKKRPNGPRARRCRSNCFQDTGDARKSHYSDSSFDRFVLLPDFNCCQLLPGLRAEQFWIINSIFSHLHIRGGAAESTPAAAVSLGEGPPSSWADGRDSGSRGTCCSGSLLMFSRFYFSFIVIWAFLHAIIGLWNAASYLDQLFLCTAAPDVPFTVWDIQEVTTAHSPAQHMNVIPSSDVKGEGSRPGRYMMEALRWWMQGFSGFWTIMAYFYGHLPCSYTGTSRRARVLTLM